MSKYKINTSLINTGVTPPGYRIPKCTFNFKFNFSSGVGQAEVYSVNVNNLNTPSIVGVEKTFESNSSNLNSAFGITLTPEVVSHPCMVQFRFTYSDGKDIKAITQEIKLQVFDSTVQGLISNYNADIKLPGNSVDTYNITLDISVKALENHNTPKNTSFIYNPVQVRSRNNERISRDFFTDDVLGNNTLDNHYTNFVSSSSDSYSVITPKVSTCYGHKEGSGSINTQSDDNDTPTRVIFNQIKNVYLNQYSSSFIDINGTQLDQFYSILFGRNDTSNVIGIDHIELNLQELLGTGKINTSGSVLSLIGDPDSILYNDDKVYAPLVSGSLVDGVYSLATEYGYVLYDNAAIILKYDELDSTLNFNTENSENIEGNNAQRLFESLSGSIGISALGDYGNNETEYSCYLNGKQYNYSNNPSSRKITGSFISSSTDLREKFSRFRFETEPQDGYSSIEAPFSYVTSVGLYDDNYNLLAVGKLSQPVKKDLYKPLSLGVRLKNA